MEVAEWAGGTAAGLGVGFELGSSWVRKVAEDRGDRPGRGFRTRGRGRRRPPKNGNERKISMNERYVSPVLRIMDEFFRKNQRIQ
jgi:hypothetical protein